MEPYNFLLLNKGRTKQVTDQTPAIAKTFETNKYAYLQDLDSEEILFKQDGKWIPHPPFESATYTLSFSFFTLFYFIFPIFLTSYIERIDGGQRPEIRGRTETCQSCILLTLLFDFNLLCDFYF